MNTALGREIAIADMDVAQMETTGNHSAELLCGYLDAYGVTLEDVLNSPEDKHIEAKHYHETIENITKTLTERD